MIGLHIWSSLESYEVLGLFGMSFFILPLCYAHDIAQVGSLVTSSSRTSLPTSSTLVSTGKYPLPDDPVATLTHVISYLNNPEVISGAAFFGLALISGSKLVFTLAVIRRLSQWWFLSKVEKSVLPLSQSVDQHAHVYLTARTCASCTATPSGATLAS